jgi:hypothetical protein
MPNCKQDMSFAQNPSATMLTNVPNEQEVLVSLMCDFFFW